ncbi:MAG: (p)ppGpp synthetase [Clostridia bacterium]|nr:(p)ppGpp synthetase [Clostridia bacterium]
MQRKTTKQTSKQLIDIHGDDITIKNEETLEINELMPVMTPQSDDMKHIANMKSEFSQTMDPILRMYNAAMNEAIARFEIIKDEFHFRKMRCPIHHIDARLKSADSILGKLEKKDLNLTLTSACNNIYDIAGVRVVCPYVKDIYLLRERIMAQDDIFIMEEKDYVAHPKRNGYRSLHIIIRVPVYFMNKKQLVPVELQIRSLAMDLWASLEHDLKYKAYQSTEEIDFTAKLYECSQLIYQAEESMEKINDLLED